MCCSGSENSSGPKMVCRGVLMRQPFCTGRLRERRICRIRQIVIVYVYSLITTLSRRRIEEFFRLLGDRFGVSRYT